MYWLMIVIAAIFEVGWVVGLKHADSFWQWTGTVICIALSFALLILAGKKLPVSTVYAVFVGLGTAGTVSVDILFFDHPFDFVQIVLIALLISGVIGLKYVTDSEQKEEEKEWLGSV